MGRAIAVLTAGLVLFAGTGPVQAGHSRGCGTLQNVKGKRDYRVSASSGVKCRFGRKWTKRYIRRGARPRKFSCSEPGGNITFYCRRKGDSSRFYYARRA